MVETSYNVMRLAQSVLLCAGCWNTLHVFQKLISFYRLKKYRPNTVLKESALTEFGKNTEF